MAGGPARIGLGDIAGGPERIGPGADPNAGPGPWDGDPIMRGGAPAPRVTGAATGAGPR